jgi:Trk-type K+ transport system membrane component
MGLGPTAVVLKQERGWTYGILGNHVWSVGGGGMENFSNTLLQRFLSFTRKDAWTFALNTESSYDWNHSQWTVPLHATASRLMTIGRLPVSIGGGVRYYAASASTGPHGWGARLVLTFLFPTK